MSLFKDELDLARYWRKKLEERYQKIYVNINLASHKFYNHWIEWWGAGTGLPPAQPQIDLLIVDRLTLLGIELKYFRMTKGRGKERINYPFYKGIEEALALLRLGFHYVSLWQCFDRELPLDIISRYNLTTSSFIRALELPINYMGFYLDKYQDKIEAYHLGITGKPYWYENKKTGKRAIPFPTPYGKMNPLKDATNPKKILEFLRMVLRIPRES